MEDSDVKAAESRLRAAEVQLREAEARGSARGRTAKDVDSWRKAAVEHGRAVVAYKEALAEANLRETKAPTASEETQESRRRTPGRL
jgi:hypothetical protein